MNAPVLVDQLELTYNSSVATQDVVWKSDESDEWKEIVCVCVCARVCER